MTDSEVQKGSQLEHVKFKGPGKWNVVMFNDDSTPMEFVVHILIAIFNKSQEEATEVMLQVHESGRAVVGTYMYEVAQQKQHETVSAARSSGFPLSCTLEEAG